MTMPPDLQPLVDQTIWWGTSAFPG